MSDLRKAVAGLQLQKSESRRKIQRGRQRKPSVAQSLLTTDVCVNRSDGVVSVRKGSKLMPYEPSRGDERVALEPKDGIKRRERTLTFSQLSDRPSNAPSISISTPFNPFESEDDLGEEQLLARGHALARDAGLAQLSLLAEHTDEEVKRGAQKCLLELHYLEEGIVGVNTFEPFFAFATSMSDNVGIQCDVLFSLVSLCTDERTQRQLVREECLIHLLALVDADDEEVQVAALNVLANVSEIHFGAEEMLVAHLVRISDTFDAEASDGLCGAVWRVVGNCCRDERSVRAFVDNNGIALVLRCILDDSGVGAEMRRMCMAILVNVAAMRGHVGALLQGDVPSLMLATLTKTSNDSESIALAAQFLCNVSKSKEAHTLLMEHVERLFVAARAHANESGAKTAYAMAVCLRNLAKNEACRGTLRRDHNGKDVARALIACPDEEVRVEARALLTLLKLPQNFARPRGFTATDDGKRLMEMLGAVDIGGAEGAEAQAALDVSARHAVTLLQRFGEHDAEEVSEAARAIARYSMASEANVERLKRTKVMQLLVTVLANRCDVSSQSVRDAILRTLAHLATLCVNTTSCTQNAAVMQLLASLCATDDESTPHCVALLAALADAEANDNVSEHWHSSGVLANLIALATSSRDDVCRHSLDALRALASLSDTYAELVSEALMRDHALNLCMRRDDTECVEALRLVAVLALNRRNTQQAMCEAGLLEQIVTLLSERTGPMLIEMALRTVQVLVANQHGLQDDAVRLGAVAPLLSHGEHAASVIRCAALRCVSEVVFDNLECQRAFADASTLDVLARLLNATESRAANVPEASGDEMPPMTLCGVSTYALECLGALVRNDPHIQKRACENSSLMQGLLSALRSDDVRDVFHAVRCVEFLVRDARQCKQALIALKFHQALTSVATACENTATAAAANALIGAHFRSETRKAKGKRTREK